MMLGTIVLSNYMNKFPSNSTERKEETEKKKIKTVHVIGDRVYLRLSSHSTWPRVSYCSTNFSQIQVLNKIFPIFLIFLSLTFIYHFVQSHLSLPLTKKRKKKKKLSLIFSLSNHRSSNSHGDLGFLPKPHLNLQIQSTLLPIADSP